MKNEAYTTTLNGWTVRIQPPKNQAKPQRTLLLLHGWTGDETVMWIFARKIPASTWIFAPRGPVQAPQSGYGWLPHTGSWPTLEEFGPAADALKAAFQKWREAVDAPQGPFDVMGFSQGAAMTYALAANYPQQVQRIIALAGFLPQADPMPGRYAALAGKRIYIAHGSQDDTVPVQMAQFAVHTLQSVGAQITYCESEVGHKLSADCLRGLENFYQ